MKYHICTFADPDKRIDGMLTTYQVRETIDNPTEEQINEALLRVAESYEPAFMRAFCFDESLTRIERWTYMFQGSRYFDFGGGIDGMGTINKNVLAVIN